MSDAFMTIKEAAEKYQKAEITIRRFVRSVVQKNDENDRQFIQPAPEEVEKLKKKSKPFSYTISNELLAKHFADQVMAAKAGKKPSASGEAQGGEYVSLLRKTNESLEEQLRVKDHQIRTLNQSLDNLGERQRETNVLMKGLQEQMLLKSGTGVVEGETSEEKSAWWKLW